MEITIKSSVVEAIGKKPFKQFGIDEDEFRWNNEITIDLKDMSVNKIQDLQNLLEQYKDVYGAKIALKGLETFLEVFKGDMPKMAHVSLFADAAAMYLVGTERRWLYHRVDGLEKQWVASRVTNIEYHPKEPSTRDRSGRPEYVEIEFLYEQFGGERTFDEEFYAKDILRKTVPEILALRGYYIETPELRKEYLEFIEKYTEVIPKIGSQYILAGVATNQIPDDEDDRSSITKEKIRDYVVNKCVIDVFVEAESEDTDRWSNRRGNRNHEDGGYFWERIEDLVKTKNKKKVEERDESPVVDIPVHPFVIIFDLQRHMRMSTHISTLTEYKYDKKLSDKLVLQEDTKQLINILIEHKAGGFIDIIRGKSGGAIILLTGKAGVGKTLTAEVFAESTEKALYSVQASQLGITIEEFEKNLKLVFRRASRWGAILLLDEADIYVHERGSNLQQNALVGIMLRLFEYQTSIMFMTTNRPDVVDDAIASRCIARIDYKYPSKEQQILIWRILADTAGIKLSDKAIEEFVNKHNNLSGRDIKNILKLANLQSVAENKPITIESINYVKQFNPTFVKQSNEESQ